MTIDELIEKMPKDGWMLYPDGKMRRRHGSLGEWSECPITSVGPRTPSGMAVFDTGNAETCASAIGLSIGDARAIIFAADSKSGCDPALRRRLLKAVGLKERA